MWLDRLEELLLAVNPVDEDWEPPAPPLGDGTALAAHQRVFTSVLAAERVAAASPIAPNRRFELIPIRFALMDPADLRKVAEALAAFGQATLPGGDDLVAGVLADHAAVHRLSVAELIAGCARAHGLLDLGADNDTARLTALLQTAEGRVVLDADDHAAYGRYVERVITLFHGGDPLTRFLYRG